ncbi:MAG: hypothetical protein NXI32_26945, partial [bacterium]|nr:hypothetical protein [bacterium]
MSYTGPGSVSLIPDAFERTRLQQRLRFLGFPDSDGEPLQVDGLEQSAAKLESALQLFASSVNVSDYSQNSDQFETLIAQLNSDVATTWTDLSAVAAGSGGSLSLAGATLASGRNYTASWTAETIRLAAEAASLAGNSIPLVISRLHVIDGSSPIDSPWIDLIPGQEFGLQLPAGLGQASTGSELTLQEEDALALLLELVKAQPQGSQVRNIQLANAKLADAVNLAAGYSLAEIVPDSLDEVRVRVQPPTPANQSLDEAIVGVVYDDANFDGVRQPTEAPFDNLTVYIDSNRNGQFDFVDADQDGTPDAGSEPWSVTDQNGRFRFSALPADSYQIGVVTPFGSEATAPLNGGHIQPGSSLALGQAYVLPPALDRGFVDDVLGEILAKLEPKLTGETGTLNDATLGLSEPGSDGEATALTYAGVIDPIQIFRSAILEPLNAAYGQQASLSLPEAIATLDGQTFSVDDVDALVSINPEYDPASGELVLHYTIDATGNKTVELDLSGAWQQEGLTLNQLPQLNLQLSSNIDFVIKLDMQSGVLSDAMVQFQAIESTATASVADLLLDGTYGFADVTIADGQATTVTTANVEVNAGEFWSVNTPTIDVQSDTSHMITGNFPVAASIGSFSTSVGASVDFVVNAGTASATSSSALEAELGPLRLLDAYRLSSTFEQLSSGLERSSRTALGDWTTPLTGSANLAENVIIAEALDDALVRSLGGVRLAAVDVPASFNFPAPLNAILKITRLGEEDRLIALTMPADVNGVGSNLSLFDLVEDLDATLAAGFGEEIPSVRVSSASGKLTFTAVDPSITNLSLENSESLGFTAFQEASGLGFSSINSFLQLAAQELGVPANQLSATYDPLEPSIQFQLNGISVVNDAGPLDLRFDATAAGLKSLQVNGDVSLQSELQSNLGFGFVLTPLGTGQPFESSTLLSDLNAGAGVTIEEDLDHHLAVTLATSSTGADAGDVILIDLRGVTMLGELKQRMEAASDLGNGPRIQVDLDAESKSITVTDLTAANKTEATEIVEDYSRIEPANGSAAGYQLAIITQDFSLDNDGIMFGSPLHGETLADRSFVDVTSSTLVSVLEGSAAQFSGTATLGVVDLNVADGSATLRGDVSFGFQSPTSNDRFTLSELLSGDEVIVVDMRAGAASASLPVALQGAITGLSLGDDPRIHLIWDQLDPDTAPRVSRQDIVPLLQLEKLSLLGLTEATPLADLSQGHGVPTGTASDLVISLNDGSVINVELTDSNTVGDVLSKLRNAGGGSLFAEIRDDGLGLSVQDETDGAATFSITGSAASGLGLDVSVSQDGDLIVGRQVFEQSVLSALSQIGDIFQQFSESPSFTASLPLIEQSLADVFAPQDFIAGGTAAYRQGQVTSLQNLAAAVATALGITQEDVSVSLSGSSLGLSITAERSAAPSFPLNIPLDSPAASRLIDLDRQSTIDLNGNMRFAFEIGLDFANPSMPRGFVIPSSTGLSAIAKVDSQDPVQFESVVGPLSVFASSGTAILDADGNGPSTDPAQFSAGLVPLSGDFAGGRLYFDQLSLAQVASTAAGAADAELTLSAPTSADNLGLVQFSVADLGDSPSSTTVTSPDLQPLIAGINLSENLTALPGGWRALFESLDRQLRNQVLDVNLPIVGTNLTEITLFLQELQTVFDGVTGLDTPGAVDVVRQSLFSELSGLGFLQDRLDDGDSIVDINDVFVQSDADFITFGISLAATQPTITNLNFDSGLPGLGFELDNAPIDLDSSFAFDLTIGISRDDGVYFGFGPNADDFTLGFSAGLQSANLHGSLPLLEVDVEDYGSGIAGAISFNIGDESGVVRLSEIGELPFQSD